MFNGYNDTPLISFNEATQERDKKQENVGKWSDGHVPALQSAHADIWQAKPNIIGIASHANASAKCNCAGCYSDNLSYQGDSARHRPWLPRTFPVPLNGSNESCKLPGINQWETVALSNQEFCLPDGNSLPSQYLQDNGKKHPYYRHYQSSRLPELNQPGVITSVKTADLSKKDLLSKQKPEVSTPAAGQDMMYFGQNGARFQICCNSTYGLTRNFDKRLDDRSCDSNFCDSNERYSNVDSYKHSNNVVSSYSVDQHISRSPVVEPYVKAVPCNLNQNIVPSPGHRNIKENLHQSCIDQSFSETIKSIGSDSCQAINGDKSERGGFQSAMLKEGGMTKNCQPGQLNELSSPVSMELKNSDIHLDYTHFGRDLPRHYENAGEMDCQKLLFERERQNDYFSRSNPSDIIKGSNQVLLHESKKNRPLNYAEHQFRSHQVANAAKYMEAGNAKAQLTVFYPKSYASDKVSKPEKYEITQENAAFFQRNKNFLMKTNENLTVHARLTRPALIFNDPRDMRFVDRTQNSFPGAYRNFARPECFPRYNVSNRFDYPHSFGVNEVPRNDPTQYNHRNLPARMGNCNGSDQPFIAPVHNNFVFDTFCPQPGNINKTVSQQMYTGTDQLAPNVIQLHPSCIAQNHSDKSAAFNSVPTKPANYLETIQSQEMNRNGTSKISPLRLLRKKKFMSQGSEVVSKSPVPSGNSETAPALDVRKFWSTWADEEEENSMPPQMVVLDCQNIDPEQTKLLHLYESEALRTLQVDNENVVTLKSVGSEREQPIDHKVNHFDNSNGVKENDVNAEQFTSFNEPEKDSQSGAKQVQAFQFGVTGEIQSSGLKEFRENQFEGSQIQEGIGFSKNANFLPAAISDSGKASQPVYPAKQEKSTSMPKPGIAETFGEVRHCKGDTQGLKQSSSDDFAGSVEKVNGKEHGFGEEIDSSCSREAKKIDINSETNNVSGSEADKMPKRIFVNDSKASKVENEVSDGENSCEKLTALDDDSRLDSPPDGHVDFPTLSSGLPTSEYRRNKFLDYTDRKIIMGSGGTCFSETGAGLKGGDDSETHEKVIESGVPQSDNLPGSQIEEIREKTVKQECLSSKNSRSLFDKHRNDESGIIEFKSHKNASVINVLKPKEQTGLQNVEINILQKMSKANFKSSNAEAENGLANAHEIKSDGKLGAAKSRAKPGPPNREAKRNRKSEEDESNGDTDKSAMEIISDSKPAIKFSIQKSQDLKISFKVLNGECNGKKGEGKQSKGESSKGVTNELITLKLKNVQREGWNDKGDGDGPWENGLGCHRNGGAKRRNRRKLRRKKKCESEKAPVLKIKKSRYLHVEEEEEEEVEEEEEDEDEVQEEEEEDPLSACINYEEAPGSVERSASDYFESNDFQVRETVDSAKIRLTFKRQKSNHGSGCCKKAIGGKAHGTKECRQVEADDSPGDENGYSDTQNTGDESKATEKFPGFVGYDAANGYSESDQSRSLPKDLSSGNFEKDFENDGAVGVDSSNSVGHFESAPSFTISPSRTGLITPNGNAGNGIVAGENFIGDVLGEPKYFNGVDELSAGPDDSGKHSNGTIVANCFTDAKDVQSVKYDESSLDSYSETLAEDETLHEFSCDEVNIIDPLKSVSLDDKETDVNFKDFDMLSFPNENPDCVVDCLNLKKEYKTIENANGFEHFDLTSLAKESPEEPELFKEKLPVYGGNEKCQRKDSLEEFLLENDKMVDLENLANYNWVDCDSKKIIEHSNSADCDNFLQGDAEAKNSTVEGNYSRCTDNAENAKHYTETVNIEQRDSENELEESLIAKNFPVALSKVGGDTSEDNSLFDSLCGKIRDEPVTGASEWLGSVSKEPMLAQRKELVAASSPPNAVECRKHPRKEEEEEAGGEEEDSIDDEKFNAINEVLAAIFQEGEEMPKEDDRSETEKMESRRKLKTPERRCEPANDDDDDDNDDVDPAITAGCDASMDDNSTPCDPEDILSEAGFTESNASCYKEYYNDPEEVLPMDVSKVADVGNNEKILPPPLNCYPSIDFGRNGKDIEIEDFVVASKADEYNASETASNEKADDDGSDVNLNKNFGGNTSKIIGENESANPKVDDKPANGETNVVFPGKNETKNNCQIEENVSKTSRLSEIQKWVLSELKIFRPKITSRRHSSSAEIPKPDQSEEKKRHSRKSDSHPKSLAKVKCTYSEWKSRFQKAKSCPPDIVATSEPEEVVPVLNIAVEDIPLPPGNAPPENCFPFTAKTRKASKRDRANDVTSRTKDFLHPSPNAKAAEAGSPSAALFACGNAAEDAEDIPEAEKAQAFFANKKSQRSKLSDDCDSPFLLSDFQTCRNPSPPHVNECNMEIWQANGNSKIREAMKIARESAAAKELPVGLDEMADAVNADIFHENRTHLGVFQCNLVSESPDIGYKGYTEAYEEKKESQVDGSNERMDCSGGQRKPIEFSLSGNSLGSTGKSYSRIHRVEDSQRNAEGNVGESDPDCLSRVAGKYDDDDEDEDAHGNERYSSDNWKDDEVELACDDANGSDGKGEAADKGDAAERNAISEASFANDIFVRSDFYECEDIPMSEDGLPNICDSDVEKVSDDDKFRHMMQNCIDNAKKFLNVSNLKLFSCSVEDLLELDCQLTDSSLGDSDPEKCPIDPTNHISRDVLLTSCDDIIGDDFGLTEKFLQSDFSMDFMSSFNSDNSSNLCPEILPVDNWPYLEEEVPSSPTKANIDESDIIPFLENDAGFEKQISTAEDGKNFQGKRENSNSAPVYLKPQTCGNIRTEVRRASGKEIVKSHFYVSNLNGTRLRRKSAVTTHGDVYKIESKISRRRKTVDGLAGGQFFYKQTLGRNVNDLKAEITKLKNGLEKIEHLWQSNKSFKCRLSLEKLESGRREEKQTKARIPFLETKEDAGGKKPKPGKDEESANCDGKFDGTFRLSNVAAPFESQPDYKTASWQPKVMLLRISKKQLKRIQERNQAKAALRKLPDRTGRENTPKRVSLRSNVSDICESAQRVALKRQKLCPGSENSGSARDKSKSLEKHRENDAPPVRNHKTRNGDGHKRPEGTPEESLKNMLDIYDLLKGDKPHETTKSTEAGSREPISFPNKNTGRVSRGAESIRRRKSRFRNLHSKARGKTAETKVVKTERSDSVSSTTLVETERILSEIFKDSDSSIEDATPRAETQDGKKSTAGEDGRDAEAKGRRGKPAGDTSRSCRNQESPSRTQSHGEAQSRSSHRKEESKSRERQRKPADEAKRRRRSSEPRFRETSDEVNRSGKRVLRDKSRSRERHKSSEKHRPPREGDDRREKHRKRNHSAERGKEEAKTRKAANGDDEDEPDAKRSLADYGPDGPWVCEVCGFNNESERVSHIKGHPFHCQSCHLAFRTESRFVSHLTKSHKDIRNQHHCLLCELSFDTEKQYQRHLETREHRHLETVEKNTINTLFTLLTGQPCPVLGLVEMKPEWLPNQAGTVHFYHQATPLSLALQYLKMHHDLSSYYKVSSSHPN